MRRLMLTGLLVLAIAGMGLAAEDRGDLAVGWNLSMIRGFSGMTARVAVGESVELQPVFQVGGSTDSLDWSLAMRGLFSLGQRGTVYRYAFAGASAFNEYDGLGYGLQGGVGLEWRWFSSPLYNTVEFLMGYSTSGYSGVGLGTGFYYYF